MPRSLRGSSNGRSSPGSLVSASARDAGNRCVAGGPDELPEGASVTTSEVAGNRTGGRRTAVLTLDRAIPDRPSSNLACSRQFPLRVNASAWASHKLGRPVGLAGLRPGSLKLRRSRFFGEGLSDAPTLSPRGRESLFMHLDGRSPAKCLEKASEGVGMVASLSTLQN